MTTSSVNSSPLVRWLAALFLVAIVARIVVPQLGETGGDGVLDWLTVRGVADGLDYGMSIGELADHYGVDLGKASSKFPSHEEWIHPRTPGSLALLAPLLLVDVGTAADLTRVIAALTWIGLAVFLVPRIVRRDVGSVLLWMILATATAPVLMLLEFGPHLGLVSVWIGGAWWLLRRGDSLVAGVLVGLAMILRLSFGLVTVGLFVCKRPRAALSALLIWATTEVVATAAFGIDPASVVQVGRGATSQWLDVSLNGSLAAMASRLSFESDVAVLMVVIVVGAMASAVFARHRPYGAGLDVWLATTIVGAVLASPVVWEQYLIALALPLAWALCSWPASNSGVFAALVIGSQVGLLVVRAFFLQSSLRGWAIALSCVVLAGVVIARVWLAEGDGRSLGAPIRRSAHPSPVIVPGHHP